ncbi:MAG: hypothetical protein IKY87_00705 [Paludibacteraceae bacterium]|nr:hypothetical protein [Paludibacteraceae bacterium]
MEEKVYYDANGVRVSNKVWCIGGIESSNSGVARGKIIPVDAISSVDFTKKQMVVATYSFSPVFNTIWNLYARRAVGCNTRYSYDYNRIGMFTLSLFSLEKTWYRNSYT